MNRPKKKSGRKRKTEAILGPWLIASSSGAPGGDALPGCLLSGQNYKKRTNERACTGREHSF